MAKTLRGKVVSTKMQDTVVVEVVRRVAHPLYRKLLKRSKRYKVASAGQTVAVGDTVRIVETRPIAKDKHFKVLEVVKK